MSLYDDALAMLKRLEWVSDDTYSHCPICEARPSYGYHDADCELYALIKHMESTPMMCRPLGTAEQVQRER